MQNDSPENGVRTIWLNQPTEKPTMISKLIEQRSRTLRAKTRRELIGTVAGPLVAGIFYAYSMKAFPALRQVLQPSFAFAVAWGLAGLYFLNRGMWSAVMPGDVGLNTGLEVCRLEIERQRDLVRRSSGVVIWSSNAGHCHVRFGAGAGPAEGTGHNPEWTSLPDCAGCLDSLVLCDQVARTARAPARDRRTEGYRDGEP